MCILAMRKHTGNGDICAHPYLRNDVHKTKGKRDLQIAQKRPTDVAVLADNNAGHDAEAYTQARG